MKNKSESLRDLSIDENITNLAGIRTNLAELAILMPIQEIKGYLENSIFKIDKI